jgi:amino acid transporter
MATSVRRMTTAMAKSASSTTTAPSRSYSTRHITMIALGSSIGMGLWLGSGSSLASGGPAAMFLGYLLSGTMIWTVSQSIGEMAVM